MDTVTNENTLLTAIIPIKASAIDRDNVISWFSNENAQHIHFILVFDRPTTEMTQANNDLPSLFPNIRIDVIEGQFFGPGPARNEGMRKILGRYVAFWDSDDLPNFDSIISTLSHAKASPELLFVGAFEIRKSNIENRRISTSNLVDLARTPGLWRCLIPSNALSGCEFPPLRLGEDQVFLCRVLINIEEIQYVPDLFYTYKYGEPGQLTSLKDFSDLLKAEKILQSITPQNLSKDKSHFIWNLSSKNLLTVVLRGRFDLKIQAIFRLVYKVIFNKNGGLSSVLLMTRVPKKARFND